MASVSELVEDVAEIMSERIETVNACARALIDAGELPKSRGRAVAQVSSKDIVKLFTAVALEPKIKDVAQVVSDYLGMKVEMVPKGAPPSISFSAGDWLEGMLRTIYEKPDTEDDTADRKAMFDQEIVFVATWPEIEVRGEGSTIIRFRKDSSLFWNGYHKRTTVVSCRAFLMLGSGKGRDYFGAVSG